VKLLPLAGIVPLVVAPSPQSIVARRHALTFLSVVPPGDSRADLGALGAGHRAAGDRDGGGRGRGCGSAEQREDGDSTVNHSLSPNTASSRSMRLGATARVNEERRGRSNLPPAASRITVRV
jgi:hypothetical protein